MRKKKPIPHLTLDEVKWEQARGRDLANRAVMLASANVVIAIAVSIGLVAYDWPFWLYLYQIPVMMFLFAWNYEAAEIRRITSYNINRITKELFDL